MGAGVSPNRSRRRKVGLDRRVGTRVTPANPSQRSRTRMDGSSFRLAAKAHRSQLRRAGGPSAQSSSPESPASTIRLPLPWQFAWLPLRSTLDIHDVEPWDRPLEQDMRLLDRRDQDGEKTTLLPIEGVSCQTLAKLVHQTVRFSVVLSNEMNPTILLTQLLVSRSTREVLVPHTSTHKSQRV